VVIIFEKFEHTFDIKSVDKARRIIRGTASLEEEDRDGEIIAMEAIDSSLKGWLQNPVIRFKHESPIGKGLDVIDGQPGCYVNTTTKEFIVTAYISDKTQIAKEAWGLIEEGIIKSFSVGGKVLERIAVKEGNKELKKIVKMELYEVSVVDIPSNRKSFFSVIAKSIEKQEEFECPHCGKKFDSEEKRNDHKKDCPEKSAGQDIYKPGEGTHSDKWDRCVEDVKRDNPSANAYAVCTAQLGEESFRGLERGPWTEKDSKGVKELISKIDKINAPKTAGENPSLENKIIEEPKCQNQIKQTELLLKTSLLRKLRQN
jgi:DNA-directed RNA polymerase subunit RPC12/RpoP